MTSHIWQEIDRQMSKFMNLVFLVYLNTVLDDLFSYALNNL